MLIIHYHITHHAGTTFWRIANKNINEFGKGINGTMTDINIYASEEDWNKYVNKIVNCKWVNIEEPLPINVSIPNSVKNISWVITIRNPLNRLLSGDGRMNDFPEIKESANYINWINHQNNQNYSLRWLCGKSKLLTIDDLEFAKKRLKKFDIIMVVEDLNNSYKILEKVFNWKYTEIEKKNYEDPKIKINNDLEYENFIKRNILDIKLYIYGLQLALECYEKYGIKTDNLKKICLNTQMTFNKYF